MQWMSASYFFGIILSMKRNIIRIICIVVFVACFAYLGFYYYQMNRKSDETETMMSVANSSIYSNAGNIMTVEVPVEDDGADGDGVSSGTGETKNRVLTILPKYQDLYKRNKNLIGWLKIPDTQIDYPVMKSINGNGEYYLNHNYKGEEDKNGTLFMDDECDVIKPTENWIIYGHNMKSGKMFGNLTDYKSQSFYEKHPVIYFDTIYETGSYVVIYAFNSRVYDEAEITFKYYQFIDPASEAEFDSALSQMEADSLINTGMAASYGDRLLILSTCDYDEDNGRFVVVAVRQADK